MGLRPHADAPAYLQRFAILTFVAALAAMLLVVLFEGYLVTRGWGRHLALGGWAVAAILSLVYEGMLVYRAVHRRARVRSLAPDLALAACALSFAISEQRALLAFSVFCLEALVAMRIVMATSAGRRAVLAMLGRPAQLIATSFLGIIALGTIFLSLPAATTDGGGADAVDALFTATSATCVTGLAVLNTNDDPASNPALQSFSTFGQLVILILIQIGGLGIMTLSAAVVLLLGRRLGFRSQALLADVLEESSRRDLERSIRYIFKMTLVTETIGAAVLFVRFLPEFEDTSASLAAAVFMSISAYCNAGFSLWSDSLVSFRSDYWILSTIMALITIGGLGPLVVAALTDPKLFKRSAHSTWLRWPNQVRVAVVASLILTLGGAVVYFYFDFGRSLVGLSRADRLMSALFQSVTMRTAGFNTVDLSLMGPVTLVVMLLLMFVGGSSGGTAGGVKTSTMSIVFMSVRAMLTGRDDVEMGGRTIPRTVVYKAISILVIFVLLFVLGFIALLITEPETDFQAIMFETMSALATVGLSFGITPELSTAGRFVIIFLMFVGRIGPLTLALAVGERQQRAQVRYPEGRIVVG